MKNFKKIASAIAALSLAACMVAPVATMTSFATDVTIKAGTNDKGTHSYEAYKVFKGTMEEAADGTKVLVGLDWAFKDDSEGTLATQKTAFLNEVKTAVGIEKESFTAKDVADNLGTGKDPENAKKFADVVGKYTELFTSIPGTATGVTLSDAGYYMIQDASASPSGTQGAKTRYILSVVDPTESTMNIEAKAAAPSVDKLVLDETDDAEEGAKAATIAEGVTGSWGETADHAIGETFQFKLVADMPENAELDAYDVYTLKFTDKMAKGVTFESIKSVTIHYKEGTGEGGSGKAADVSINDYTADFGTLAAETGYDNSHMGNGTDAWTLTIADLVAKNTGHKLSDIESVDVIYNAHLNSAAVVTNTNVTDVDNEGKYFGESTKVNANDVFLEYSNNPNEHTWNGKGTGTPDDQTGETPKDTVGVFTYEVDNTKIDGASTERKTLADAKFKVYKSNPDAGDAGDPIKLVEVKDATNSKTLGYREATAEEAKVTTEGKVWTEEVTTGNDGVFNLYGFDTGTYYIKETEAPKGYNLLDSAIAVEIKAVHVEESETGSGATLTLNSSGKESKYDGKVVSTLEGDIKNNKGATLPSTGGIGTTLFYLGGGALVAVAGVMLITKKRMTKE